SGCCPNLNVAPRCIGAQCRLEAGATFRIRTAPPSAARRPLESNCVILADPQSFRMRAQGEGFTLITKFVSWLAWLVTLWAVSAGASLVRAEGPEVRYE